MSDNNPTKKEIDLVKIIQVILNKKITVLLFAVVAIAITHINLLNKTTEYIAKTYVKQISSYEQANYSVYILS